ncbi:MAG: phenylalanine--tRNA ligase subunit beta [Thermanaerothrix sp.]|nr:phenylalanine--tRNA ligase subunit beta [Thermanaerothrix sp.]
MRVHLGWLRKLVEINVSLDGLIDCLTMTGTEVEEVIKPVGASSGILIAQVEDVALHPSKPSLSVAKVNYRSGNATVVTGARNVEKGGLFPYAPPGARICDGAELSVRSFNGVDSHGMLLSCEELGLEGLDASGGLLKLPSDAPLGEDFLSWAELDQPVLDLSITPNRGDLCSMIGVAREVSALTGGKLLPVEMPDINWSDEDWSSRFQLKVCDDGCWKYLLGFCEVKFLGESQFFDRLKLVLSGMRPLNNVVDPTNLAMLLFGHPLHAFDANRLPSGSVEVRGAVAGETLRTLDGRDRELQDKDLIICSSGVPIAIAGVMGGEDAEVKKDTKAILLESAVFDPARVSVTSRRLGISSQAAFRYSRSVDWNVSEVAALYALGKMSYGGAVVVGRGFLEHQRDFRIDRRISLRLSSLKRVLLMDSLEQAACILESLGFEREEISSSHAVFSVPSWRSDVEGEEDLIEEVGRVRGYHLVEPRIPGNLRGRGIVPRAFELSNSLRRVAISRGYVEVMTYSFTSPEELGELGVSHEGSPRIVNPISREHLIMRPLIAVGLIRGLRGNLSSGWRKPVRIFETGNVFVSEGESHHVAGLVFVGKDTRSVHGERVVEDFFSIKADVEAMLESAGVKAVWIRGREPFGHAGQTAHVVVDGRRIGFLCRLKPSIERELGADEGVFVFELNTDGLLNGPLPRFGGSSKFPSVSRDMAIMVASDVPAVQVEEVIRELMDPNLAVAVELFDVYMGKGLPEGCKSLAFSVVYRHPERTLRDDEVDQVHFALRQKLQDRGYSLR